jgi:hypothetical protein
MKKEAASGGKGVATCRGDNFPYILVVCKHYPAGAQLQDSNTRPH